MYKHQARKADGYHTDVWYILWISLLIQDVHTSNECPLLVVGWCLVVVSGEGGNVEGGG